MKKIITLLIAVALASPVLLMAKAYNNTTMIIMGVITAKTPVDKKLTIRRANKQLVTIVAENIYSKVAVGDTVSLTTRAGQSTVRIYKTPKKK